MGARLAHRGTHSYCWSPAANVWLGEVRYSPRADDEDELTAFSGQLYLDWRQYDFAKGDDGRLNRDREQRRIATVAAHKEPLGFATGLDGSFAVACWEPTQQRLVLTVDRLRYERIYFTEVSGRFVFASEYKALLALEDVDAVPDPDAIQYSIATIFPNNDRTLCRGIKTVLPGHTLVAGKKRTDFNRYFEPRCVPGKGSLQEFSLGLRQILIDDVQALLSHHDRIAITLSGGLDSAGLLGVLRHALPDVTLVAYTIATNSQDPDLIGARNAASYFDIEHNEYEFDPASITSDLPKLVWLAEEFACREESILQYQLESQVLRCEPVLTNGRGADNALAGMPRNKLIRMAETLPFLRTGMSEVYQHTQSGAPPKSALGQLGQWLLYRGSAIEPPRIHGAEAPTRVYEPNSVADARSRAMTNNTSNQFHSAFASMAPTDVIMPFMSNNFREYCLRIPTRHLIGIFSQKKILREALKPFIPDEIRKRRKTIQRANRDIALSDAIDALANALLSADAVKHRGLLETQYVARMRERPADGVYRGDQLTRLWMLIITEIWCRTFVDQGGEPWGFERDQLWASTPRKL